MPPQDSVIILVLVFVLNPPPHDFEHAPLVQELHLQCTKNTFNLIKVTNLNYRTCTKALVPGQHWILQFSVIDELPVHFPPQDSVIILVLVFVVDPPPQDFEHAPLVQEVHWQFTTNTRNWIFTINHTYRILLRCLIPGQQWVLQSSVIDEPPLHFPPQNSVLIIVLVLVLVPPPHGLVHVSLVQELHWQFT